MLLIWSVGLSALALFAVIAWYLSPLEPGIVALQFSFSRQSFQLILDAWGPEGVALYRSHFTADFALLICYSALGYLVAENTRLFRRQSAVRRLGTWLLPAAALSDALENVLHLHLIADGPEVDPLYVAAALFASLKWTLFSAFLVLVAGVLIRRESSSRRRGIG